MEEQNVSEWHGGILSVVHSNRGWCIMVVVDEGLISSVVEVFAIRLQLRGLFEITLESNVSEQRTGQDNEEEFGTVIT